MCVQGVDVQCVLQFTLIHAAGCALHRLTSRVIHRLELFVSLSLVEALRPLQMHHRPYVRGEKGEALERRGAEGLLPSPYTWAQPCLPAHARRRYPDEQPPIRLSSKDEPDQRALVRGTEPIMILPQVHLRKPCYDFYFL